MAFVMEAFDGCLFDGPVHSLDLTIGPGMLWLGEAVLDLVSGTGNVEGVCPEWRLVFNHLFDVRHGPAVSGGIGEVCAIVGKHGMHLVGNGFDQV